MARKRYTEEQIIAVLNEAEAGAKTGELCRRHGMSAGTQATASVSLVATDTTAPEVSSAQVSGDGTTIDIVFDEALDTTGAAPAADVFDVTVDGGTAVNPASVAFHATDANTAVLTMASADTIAAGGTVVLAYDKPASNALADAASNQVVSFTGTDAIAALNRPAAPVVTLTAGDGKLTATWAAPANGGSAITGYDVEWKTGSQTWAEAATAAQSATAAASPYDITSLTNGTEYTVRVRAANAAGDGPWSAEASETPDSSIINVTAEFDADAYTAIEGRGAVTITVTLSADPERSVTIPITAAGANGAGSGDYSLSATSVTIAGGDTSATFTVTAEDDNFYDGDGNDETLTLGFGTLPGGVTTGTQDTATVSLLDNEILVTSDLVPEGTAVGEGFRLLFVTSNRRTAQSSDIAKYNKFVQDAAAAGHADIQDYSSLFRALGSTASIDARDNTATNPNEDGPGEEIRWLNGPRAADDYADFYDGSWDHRDPGRNQDGDVHDFAGGDVGPVWTGSQSNGQGVSGQELGAASVATAHPGRGEGKEINDTGATQANASKRLYGLSFGLRVGVPDDTPYVIGVEVNPEPANGKYETNDTITVEVTFSEAVSLSGTGMPTFPLEIGANTRDLAYQSISADGMALTFSYTVVDDDLDLDGISSAAKTLDLPSTASITRLNDTTVDAFLGPIALSTDFVVNLPPLITDVDVTSTPRATAANDTYGLGEDIEITVEFNEAVEVTGDVIFRFNTGGGSGQRQARLARGSGTDKLVFAYTVQSGDSDTNGIFIAHPGHANHPTLSLDAGQSIASALSGRDALLEHSEVGSQPNHKVDGSLTGADATLSALSLSGITLDQTFTAGAAGTAITSFTATTDASTTMVTATASQSGGSSAVVITPADADTNTTDHEVSLDMGDTVITVVVTSTNGDSTRTYTVTVTREAATDTTAPEVSSATVSGNGTTIDVVFDEDLDNTVSAPAASAFEVTVDGGTAVNPAGVAFHATNANTIMLTMGTAVAAGGTVVLAYDKPASNALADAASNQVVSFTGTDAIAALNRPAAPAVTLTPASGKITAAWTAPANGGSEVTGYDVEWKTAAQTWAQAATAGQSDTAAADATAHEITGLTNGIEYTVRVRAGNDTGDGPWSAEASANAGSSEADLSGLTVDGTGVAGFAADTTEYTVTVDRATTQVTVAATLSDSNATVEIAPADGDTGTTDHQVDLAGGKTAVTVTVTAEDGTTTKDYTVNFHRPVVPHDWSLRPEGVPTGETFRVLIVTSTARKGESEDIADYDAHVRSALADRGHTDIRDYGPLFKALAATEGGAAPRSHTDTDPEDDGPGEEIWWLNGPKAADDYSDFYNGSWDHSNPARTQSGGTKTFKDPTTAVAIEDRYVWTGTWANGKSSNRPLGYSDGTSYVGSPYTGGVWYTGFVALAHTYRAGLYGLSAVMSIEPPDAPYATVAAVTTEPANGTDYRTGETITATVTFSEAVEVDITSGSPRLPLEIGANTRDLAYQSISADGLVLTFSYEVVGDDQDLDGVTVDKSSLKLNGATIRGTTGDHAGVDAALTHTGVAADGNQRVNQPPLITDIEVTSSPKADPSNDTYGLGEDIEITVTFSEAVTVTGDVIFRFSTGGESGQRQARLAGGSGTDKLVFAYTVQSGDTDTNGIFIAHPGHAKHPTLSLDAGQSIASALSGRDALLEHSEVGSQSDHKVDGSLTGADATLSALSLSGITLDQTFTAGAAGTAITSFTATTDASTTMVTATASQSGGSSAVVITPADADTSTTDHDVSLDVGDTVITVVVTSTNGDSTRAYTVTVTREVAADNDVPQVTVEFGAASYTATEGGTAATVAVNLSADPERSVTIPITAAGADGAGSGDYSLSATSATFTVTATDDSDDDDRESVTLSFGTLPGGVSEGAQATATVSLVDDDGATPVAVTVEFDADAYTAIEGRGAVTITVTLSADPERSVTIPITAAGANGAGSGDYSLSANSVTISSGDTSATFTVTAEDDNFYDGDGDGNDETLTLGFGTLPGGVTTGTQDTATVSLLDNEILVTSDLVPEGTAVGEGFRLLFVTSNRRTAQSSDIAKYNAFVQDAAASGHADIQDYSSLFRALGSTASIDARDNTATNPDKDGPGEEIWWLNGPKAADDYADFYDDSWDHRDPARNQNGAVHDFPTGVLGPVWTGSRSNGQGKSGSRLGDNLVATGSPGHGRGSEIDSNGVSTHNGAKRLYGLSLGLRVGLTADTPYVIGVEVNPEPANGKYETNDTVTVEVTFSEAVSLSGTGTPTFPLEIGANTRDLAYQSISSDGMALTFSYTVVDDDRDLDGISSAAKTLDLPSTASITRLNDSTVDAFLAPIALSTDFVVNLPPLITDIEVTSSPKADPSNDTYGLGEDIEITVTFSEAVEVEGDVDFGLSVGGAERAPLARGNGTTELVFAYTVQSGDTDTNGIWIVDHTHATNPTFDLQTGQTVVGVDSGRDALLEHEEPGHQTDHKVDGSLTGADATLSALSLSGITLDQTFTAGAAGTAITSFTATTMASTTMVTATASQSGGSSAVDIDPADADTNTTDHEVSLDVGDTVITVTVTSTNGDSMRAYTVTVTREAAADTTAPSPSSAQVSGDGTSISLVFDKDLDGTTVPATSTFAVTLGGAAAVAPSRVAFDPILKNTVDLFMSAAIAAGETVSVDYTAPTTGGLQDAAGVAVESFTGQAAVNRPAAPAGVRVFAGNARVDVEWDLPASGAAPADYRVYWKKTSDVGFVLSRSALAGQDSEGQAVTTYGITGLTNGDKYLIRVEPLDSEDQGGDTADSAEVTVGRPKAVRNVTASLRAEDFRLSWDAPEERGEGFLQDAEGNPVLVYRISWRSHQGQTEGALQLQKECQTGTALNRFIVWVPAGGGEYYSAFPDGGEIFTFTVEARFQAGSAPVLTNCRNQSDFGPKVETTATATEDAAMASEEDHAAVRAALAAVVAARAVRWPWLRTAWDHVDDLTVQAADLDPGSEGNTEVECTTTSNSPDNLGGCTFSELTIDIDWDLLPEEDFEYVAVHELAHVWTLITDLHDQDTRGPVGRTVLYFLGQEYEGSSEVMELCALETLADALSHVAEGVAPASLAYYGDRCFSDGRTEPAVLSEEVALHAMHPSGNDPDGVDATSSWFTDTFTGATASADAWDAVSKIGSACHRFLVMNLFQNEFNGYCSIRAANVAVSAGSDITDPWKDGGCEPDAPAVTADPGPVAGSIELSWTVPDDVGGAPLLGYEVQWRASYQTWGWSISLGNTKQVDATVTSDGILDLTPGATYVVRVLARNSIGDGVSGDESVTAASAARSSPPPPKNVRAVEEAGGVRLTWQSPDGATVTGYRIERRRTGEDEDPSDRQRSVGGPRDHHTLAEDTGSADTGYTDESAEKGVEYEYRVSARNESGAGEGSDWVRAGPASASNSPATGSPTINGTAEVGETLTADTSGIADTDGLTNVSYDYQWLADGADIAGATGSTYTPVDGDQGKAIRVRVSFTDDAGNAETLTSAATGPVLGDGPPGAPLNLTVTAGDREVTLSWEPPGDNGAPPVKSYRIEWRIDGKDYSRSQRDISSKTAYTRTHLANGVKYVFRVRAENGSGYSYGPYGPASGEVSATPTSGSAVVLGTPVLSEPENLHHGMVRLDWQDIEDAGWYVVQYYQIGGGSQEWLDLPAVGVDIAFHGSSAVVSNLPGLSWLRVGAVSCEGESEWSEIEQLIGTKASDWEGVPVPVVEEGDETEPCPVVLGTPVLSEPEYLHHGMVQLDWQDIEDAGWYVVQYYHIGGGSQEWLDLPAVGVDIAFHGSSAVVSNLHGFSWLRVRAMSCAGESEWSQIEQLFGTNASDWKDVPVPEVAEGDVTKPCDEGPDTPDNSPATGEPTINGTAQVGETLTADTSGIADADGLGNVQYEYQWLADDTDTSGATGSTRTLADSDAGKAVRVRVNFTDDAGNEETLTSAATASVAGAESAEPPPEPNSPAAGAPTISGTAQVGETLTADTSGVIDADGLDDATFSYQWLSDDAAIQDATGSSYTLADSDAGKTVKVRVSFTDDAGNEETVTSAATAAVADAPSTEPPSKPTGLAAEASHDSIVLTWDDPQDDSITGYVILRRNRDTDAKGEFTTLVADTGTDAATYTDDAVAAETRYTYRIKAINGAGESERSRWFHIDTPAAPVPDKPTGLSATASHDSVTLTWDDPGDDTITGYVILRRIPGVDPQGHFDELVADTGTDATTYTDDTVAAETRYTYRIKAINEHGTSERSRWFHIDTPAAP